MMEVSVNKIVISTKINILINIEGNNIIEDIRIDLNHLIDDIRNSRYGSVGSTSNLMNLLCKISNELKSQ
jgi:hypothetical protein